MDWFDPDPVFALEVNSLCPDDLLVFLPDKFKKPDALAFPKPLGQLPPGTYYAQALIDVDQTRRDFNQGPGNLYSRPLRVELKGDLGATYALIADQIVPEPEYVETEWVKFVKVRSSLLSQFSGRDVFLQASVLLPFGYASEPERHYPALYTIPGFGGRHDSALQVPKRKGEHWSDWSTGKKPFRGFEIILDPDVPLGHSVWANSANNGPVGDALIQELIPAIEQCFRIIPEARARFVGGHSSGGWSSLWLQVNYPETFGGCWSTAPDPVDFRSFQTMNIYADLNGFWTPEGQPRPVARTRYEPRLTFVRMNHWEYVLGYGGQLDSFDAVFSPRTAEGHPQRLMNKLTGVIDPAVAEYWKRYDIRLLLQNHWGELGPKLKGKLHVIAGAWDTFYLEPAVERLKAFLDTTDHGGYVEILPGDHGSFYDAEFKARIYREIAEQVAKASPGAKVTP